MYKKSMFLGCVVVLAGMAGPALADLLVHYGLNETVGSVAHDSVGNNDGSVSSNYWATPGANPGAPGTEQIDLEDLQAVAGILLQAGSPFVVEVEAGHCGNMNDDLQIDLEDLQAVAGILLDAGSPFVVQCD
jgi:hypothetical protein